MSYSNGIGALPSAAPQQAADVRRPEINAAANGSQSTASTGLINANDQTSLSPASRLLAQALNGSDVRSEKVASLQQAIASGTYNVPSADVAHKLVQSLLGQ